MNKTLIIIGLVLALGGIVYAALPAEAHMALMGGSDGAQMEGMASGEMQDMAGHHNHGASVSTGIAVAGVGLGLAIAGWKIFD